MHGDDEILADIALGDPVSPEQAAHLAECSTCRQDLAELESALGATRAAGDVAWTSPGEHVLDGIRRDLGLARPSVAPAPDGSAAATPLSPAPTARPGVGRRTLIVGMLAAGVLGAGGTWLATRGTPTRFLAEVALTTLDTARQLGQAQLRRGAKGLELSISVHGLVPGDGYLEVWLINKDLKRMVSVGVLPADAEQQDFAVDEALIDNGYLIVDISREAFDDKPQHSGDSLVRGILPL